MTEKIVFRGEVLDNIQENELSSGFYKIRNTSTGKSYNIKSERFDSFETPVIGSFFNFMSWVEEDREFIIVINPKYELNVEYYFEIESFYYSENNSRIYNLISSYNKPLRVYGKIFQNEQIKKVKCKVIDYHYSGLPVLENIDFELCPWKLNTIYNFKIIRFREDDDNVFCLDLDLGFGQTNTVLSNWHNAEVWEYDEINCLVYGFTKSGIPKLKIEDSRHPTYKVGEIYPFKVVRFLDKIDKEGKKIKVISLSDNSNAKIEVLAFPNQVSKIKAGAYIDCTVIKINSRIQLNQVFQGDPFFYRFDEIENDLSIEAKFFIPFIESEDIFYKKLQDQYNQGSGFWILTYLNVIIPQQIINYKQRKDLPNLLQLIKLSQKFNNWVLNSGFLQAVPDKKIAKEKVKYSIEKNKVEVFVIESILKQDTKIFYDELNRTKNLVFLVSYISYFDIDALSFNELKEFILHDNIVHNVTAENKVFLRLIMNTIIFKLGDINKIIEHNSFIFSETDLKNRQNQIITIVNWLVLCSEICSITESHQKRNLLFSKALRLISYTINDNKIQKQIIEYSFSILKDNINSDFKPIQFKNNSIHINEELFNTEYKKSALSLLNDPYYLVNLNEKHYKGYKINYNGYVGYLPYELIKDNILKHQLSEKIQWATNVQIKYFCEYFGIFIAEQTPKESHEYFSKNLLIDKIIIGQIIECRVKNITNIGVFVSTIYGEGLIHISEINFSIVTEEDLNILFEKSMKIYAKVLSVNDGKIELSFKKLKGTEYEEEFFHVIYNQKNFSEITIENSRDYFLMSYEEEKGYLFDRAAIMSIDIDSKIKYWNFAKYFFSISNNARSYICAIYIKYFELLNKLDDIIIDYTYSKYNLFKTEIIHLKQEVHDKTIENFPEAKNLVFFIDILSLFNSSDDKDIEELYNIIKSYNSSDENILVPAAKNALANNLLISELVSENQEDLDQFTLKNLKRIRAFISKGVMYVSDNHEDILEIEVEKKRKFWKSKISTDEGENLEFKATFKTPVSNNNKEKIIETIKEQIIRTSDEKKIEKLQNKLNELLTVNHSDPKIQSKLIHSALKTVCAFANTKGGTLLLGVSDDKNIFGLEQDYLSFKNSDRDSFGKFFDSMINEYFGKSFSASYLTKEFLKFPEGDILIVNVEPSMEEIFLMRNDLGEIEESLYVRHLSSTEKLSGSELAKFIKRKILKNSSS